jgi:hypothetical protein
MREPGDSCPMGPPMTSEEQVLRDEVERLRAELAEAQREIKNLRGFKRGVEAALNEGDGGYRP